MIVKVQRSLTSFNGEEYVLIYNEERSVFTMIPLTAVWREKLGNQWKRYFEADYVEGKLVIGAAVPCQDW